MKFTLAATLLLYVALLASLGGAEAVPAATSMCDDTMPTKAIMTSCTPYVMGAAPMPMWGSGAYACCMALRSTPLTCLCSRSASLPPYYLQLINFQAVKNVMQTCGLQVPSGTTCGGVKLGN